jgi:hypothetical protein
MKLVELVIQNVPESIPLFEHIEIFGGGLQLRSRRRHRKMCA